MISHLTRFAFASLALIGFAGPAQAALIAETFLGNCDADGCDGSTLYLGVDDDGGSGNWIITYTVNADDYIDVKDGINQIGFKVITGWNTSLSTVTGPTGSGAWSLIEAATSSSANGPCDPNHGNPNDKVCSSGFVNITSDGEYTWEFYIVGGTLITDTSEWHLGGQYADGGGRARGQIWSTSGSGVPVPEPTAAVLFGLGAILVARRTQRS
ncbi:MAG: hypothetical protein JRD03_06450 [Deltaproteobacteria bacterium]|nr:hypothetical protein [Deltaproteobacteria bacterium]